MSSPVEQIKERLDIVDLIRSYIKLEKAGSNFKASCPFHAEKNPSFFVSPSKQMWHCFSCSKGGDHFQFIQDLEGVDFPEALRMLADRAGVQLRREDPRARSERNRLLSLLEDATAFYESNLLRRKDVGAYLKERGLAGETAKRFRMGYAEKGWENLLNHLLSKGYTPDEIEKTGLVIKSDKTQSAHHSSPATHYDRFRARIMFPLFDSSGRIVGFSGRIFEKDAEGQKDADAKYINTPQTILYDKSKILYGFHHGKDTIRKENTAILVEGQMDVALSHQAGVTHAVAVSGTAFSAMHAAFLRRLAGTLLVAFDRDSAGFHASKRAATEALSHGFDVKAVPLPAGKDPADVIKESPDTWKNAIAASKPLIAFFMDSVDEENTDARAMLHGVRVHVLPYVSRIVSEMERAHWIKEIAHRLRIAEDAVWKEIAALPKDNQTKPIHGASSQKKISHSRKDIIEERILGMLAWKEKNIGVLLPLCKEEWFSDARRPLFTSLAHKTAGNTNHYIKKLALEAEIAHKDSGHAEEEGSMLAEELRKEYVREKLQMLASDIRNAEEKGADNMLAAKMDELKRLSQELHGGGES